MEPLGKYIALSAQVQAVFISSKRTLRRHYPNFLRSSDAYKIRWLSCGP